MIAVDTEEVLAVFPRDHCTNIGDVWTFEAQLRREHGVDDQDRGLALRDSALRPLDTETLTKAMRRR